MLWGPKSETALTLYATPAAAAYLRHLTLRTCARWRHGTPSSDDDDVDEGMADEEAMVEGGAGDDEVMEEDDEEDEEEEEEEEEEGGGEDVDVLEGIVWVALAEAPRAL